MARAVADWLSSLSLSQYTEAFIENGYDDMTMCQALNEDDIDAIGVESVHDRQSILAASLKLQEDAASRAVYYELQPETDEVRSEKPASMYMQLEAEQTVKIPKMKLKIMIRDELRTDDVDLAEEPYSNPDGTPGESLNDLVEVYALQFSTYIEDVESCVETLRKSIISSRLSMSSQTSQPTSQPTSPVQKGQPQRPQPPSKPVRKLADSTVETGSRKPPPRPSSASSVGSELNNDKVKKAPPKPRRALLSENPGDYINFDEIESLPPPVSERRKSQSEKGDEPEAAPRNTATKEGGTRVAPQRPKAKRFFRKRSQDAEHTNDKEDSEKTIKTAEDDMVIDESNESIEAAQEEMADVSRGDSKLSGVKQSVSRGFQELKVRLRKFKSTASGSSASESASSSPAVSPPPANVVPVTDIGGFVAKDITMSDDERLKLMTMVKEGKCSIDEALSQIQQYEEERQMKADEDKEPVIREAVVEEEDDLPVEKTQEQKMVPPPKPTRLTTSAQLPQEEEVGVTKEEEVKSPPQPPTRPVAPPRRSRPVTMSNSEAESQGQVTVNEAKGKQDDNEIEEDRTAEAKSVKSKLKDMKSRLSGLMHGKKASPHAIVAEKTIDENEEEHDTPTVDAKANQGADGEEVGGKSAKKGFFKSVARIGKKDKSKKEQTVDNLIVLEEDTTIDETTDEPSEQTVVKGIDPVIHEVAAEDKSKRSSTFIGGSLNKLKEKFKKKHQQEPKIAISEAKACENEGSASNGARVLLNAAVSRESISSQASGGSYESSTSTSESPGIYRGPVVGRARVLQNFVPSAYDTESLTLKVGDFINVIHTSEDGLWTGELNGRVGQFKFIYVEMLKDEPDALADMSCASPSTQRKTIQELPSTVNEFLVKLGLQDRQEQFVLNGYDNMDVIKKIDRVVLDELGITEAQQRKAILTLVKQLNDASSIDTTASHKKLAPVPPGARRSPAPAPPIFKRPTSLSRLASETEASICDEVKAKKQAPRPPANKPVSQRSGEAVASPTASRKTPLKPESIQPKPGDGEAAVKLSPRPSVRRLAPHAPGTKGSVSDDGSKQVPASSHVQHQPHAGNNTVRPLPRKRVGTSAESPLRVSRVVDPKPQPRLRSATVSAKPVATQRAIPACEEKQPSSNNARSEPEVANPAPPRQKPVKPSPFAGTKPVVRPVAVAVLQETGTGKPALTPAAKPTPPTKRVLPTQAKHSAVPPKPIQTTQTTPRVSNGVPASDPSRPVAPARRHRKPITSPINPSIVKKLVVDRIDLTEAPYSAEDGACGIPVGLIHRYAEELRLSPKDVATNLENMRSNELKEAGREVVAMDSSISETDWTDSVNTVSVESFLLSVGLPFLIDCLSSELTDMKKMIDVSDEKLLELGVRDPRHLKRINRAIAVVKEKT